MVPSSERRKTRTGRGQGVAGVDPADHNWPARLLRALRREGDGGGGQLRLPRRLQHHQQLVERERRARGRVQADRGPSAAPESQPSLNEFH